MQDSSTCRAFLPFSEPASCWLGPHVIDLLERAGYGLLFINEAGLLVFCNVSARKALGWQQRLLIGARLEELNLAQTTGLELKSMLKQQRTALRTQIQLSDGSEQEWVIGPVRFGPLQERGLLLMLRPLASQLEMLASCGERMASVCHNLNNQLARVRAWAEVIAQQAQMVGCSPEVIQELSQSLGGFEEQIEEILHPLRASIHRSVDLIPLVEQAWATACTALGDLWACQLRLESFGGHISVSGREDKIQSVLQNILKNAMEASPSGWVHCLIEQEQQEVILHIADGGEGVQEQMFLQPHSHKEGGHGLGLSDVQRSLLQMGGSLDIAIGPDSRRSLIIRLPAA